MLIDWAETEGFGDGAASEAYELVFVRLLPTVAYFMVLIPLYSSQRVWCSFTCAAEFACFQALLRDIMTLVSS